MRYIMRDRPGQGRHHMDTFFSSQLRSGLKSLSLQDTAHTERRLDDGLPWDSFAWVEIDDERVGVLKILHRRVLRQRPL